MNESIEIENLGSIKYINLPKISKCTIIVGKSSSGKSTIIKALNIMRCIFRRIIYATI
jgi:AAA15 family ATPase/GTPase